MIDFKLNGIAIYVATHGCIASILKEYVSIWLAIVSLVEKISLCNICMKCAHEKTCKALFKEGLNYGVCLKMCND